MHNCLPHQVRSLLASTEAYEADAGALQRVRKAGGYDADFSSGSSVDVHASAHHGALPSPQVRCGLVARTLPDRGWAPEASSRGLVMHRGVVVGRASDADPDGRDLIEIIPGASGGSEDAARERWANPIEARETCAHPHPRLRSPRYERPVLNAAGHGPGPIVRSGVRSSSRFRFRARFGRFPGASGTVLRNVRRCMIPHWHCDPVQFQRRILLTSRAGV